MSTAREQVARIIDPETFELIEHYNALDSDPRGEEGTFKAYPQLREQRDAAFAKADAILATLLSSQEAEIAELRKALEPFALLDMPAADKWTCGTFLIEHSDICRARALSAR